MQQIQAPFRNPGLMFISLLSFSIGLFPLYYFLSKKVVNTFIEKQYEILLSDDKTTEMK